MSALHFDLINIRETRQNNNQILSVHCYEYSLSRSTQLGRQLEFPALALKERGVSSQSHKACSPSVLSLQTQIWWQSWCIWQRTMSSGYWMNGPQYCTEWACNHIKAELLFKSSGQLYSMCTSPLRHGEQWDACTRALLACCRAGLPRPLGCLIKSETTTFAWFSGMDACREGKKIETATAIIPLPHCS